MRSSSTLRCMVYGIIFSTKKPTNDGMTDHTT